MQETNLADMLKKAMNTIQKTAPGPPKDTATATPAMLPRPIVADSADVNAWKWLIWPVSLGLSYFPLTISIEWRNPLTFIKLK